MSYSLKFVLYSGGWIFTFKLVVLLVGDDVYPVIFVLYLSQISLLVRKNSLKQGGIFTPCVVSRRRPTPPLQYLIYKHPLPLLVRLDNSNRISPFCEFVLIDATRIRYFVRNFAKIFPDWGQGGSLHCYTLYPQRDNLIFPTRSTTIIFLFLQRSCANNPDITPLWRPRSYDTKLSTQKISQISPFLVFLNINSTLCEVSLLNMQKKIQKLRNCMQFGFCFDCCVQDCDNNGFTLMFLAPFVSSVIRINVPSCTPTYNCN